MLREGGLDFEEAVVEHALQAGFQQEPTVRMLKPRGAHAAGWEPILCFRKPHATSSTRSPEHQVEEEVNLDSLVGDW